MDRHGTAKNRTLQVLFSNTVNQIFLEGAALAMGSLEEPLEGPGLSQEVKFVPLTFFPVVSRMKKFRWSICRQYRLEVLQQYGLIVIFTMFLR
jgi:hypothetical protein